MKQNKKRIGIVTAWLISLLIVATFVYLVYAQTASTFWITEGVYPQGTYTLWDEGSTYYAKDEYGRINDNYGTNFSLVLNSVVGEDRKIVIKTGDYYADSPIDASYHGLTIEGEGKYATTIHAMNDLGETINDKPSGIFYVGFATGTTLSKGVRIANLGLDGQGYHMTHLIWYDKVEDGIIDNVYVTGANTSDCGGWVDLGSASWRCVITESVAVETGNGFANEGFFHNHASCSVISNCVTYGGIDANTPAIKGGEFGGSIIGNTLHNPYLGIRAESEDKSLIVSNNYIYGARGKGIQVVSGKDNGIIEGNVVFWSMGHAIDVRGNDVIINDNWVYNVTGVGILLEGSYCTISANFINVTTESGIQIQTNSSIVSENQVYNSGHDGIQLKGISLNNLITSNICDGSSDDGIEERDSSDYNVLIGDIATNSGDYNIKIIGANSQVNLCYNGTTWIS